MCSVAEKPPADNRQPPDSRSLPGNDSPRLSPRRQKETLLPEVTRLALEGHTGQAIARKVGLSKRTVNHWLQKLRQEWAAKAAEAAGELFALELARLDSIYREAMQAWRASQTDIQVRLREQVAVAGKDPRKKNSVRTQRQRANAALLARATVAVMASTRLKGRKAPKPKPIDTSDLDQEPIPAETTRTYDSLEIPEHGTLAADKWWLEFAEEVVPEMPFDELYEAAWHLRNVIEAEGGTMPAELEDQDLEHMTDDELRAHRTLLMAAIHKALYADEDSPPAPESSPPQPLSNQGL